MRTIRAAMYLAISLALAGCAGKNPPPAEPVAQPAPGPAGEQAPAAPAGEQTPAAPAGEQAPAAAQEQAAAPETPECTAAEDCAQKGKPAKGMAWACKEGKCTEEKKGKKAKAK